jgi:hypothetical protein
VPGCLRKVFDLRTNGIAEGVHLAIEIHLLDFGLRYVLIRVVKAKLEHGELLTKCSKIGAFLLFLTVGVGPDLGRTMDRWWRSETPH